MPSVDEDGEGVKLPYTADGSVNWYNHFGKQFVNFLKVKHTLSHDGTTLFLGTQENKNISPNRDLYTNVHSDFT